MNSAPPSYADVGFSIAAVERETGLSKDTLRAWEKRYGFPDPERDAHDDRRYSAAQVQRLKLIKRLLDTGFRPGKIVGLNEQELQSHLDKNQILSKTTTLPSTDELFLKPFLDALAAHDPHTLRTTLNHAQIRLGLKAFVLDVVAPLTTAVGNAWEQGQFEVFEEHLYTEVVTGLLRTCITSLATQPNSFRPRVLLTTLPQEPHSIGLLMVEAILTLEGCACISLGTQTPINDIVLATHAHEIDVVALSFTEVLNSTVVSAGLKSLRHALPEHVSIWVGGSCTALYQKPFPGISANRALTSLEGLVQHWRASAMTRDQGLAAPEANTRL